MRKVTTTYLYSVVLMLIMGLGTISYLALTVANAAREN